jgi:tRNA (adenine-N(1)-)-methyltransferase non-catalytic subunit
LLQIYKFVSLDCFQHPKAILLSLIKYLAPSRPFVVYSPFAEPLMETYLAVKDTGKAVMVMMTETWLRNYQVHKRKNKFA